MSLQIMQKVSTKYWIYQPCSMDLKCYIGLFCFGFFLKTKNLEKFAYIYIAIIQQKNTLYS